jgi:hypothetical protein
MTAREESRAIPADVRWAVDDRDNQTCRVCGEFLGSQRALHHIFFGGGSGPGMGGRRVHEVGNVITLGWHFPHRDCHCLVHADKELYQSVLAYLASGVPGTGGQTAVAVLRRQGVWR